MIKQNRRVKYFKSLKMVFIFISSMIFFASSAYGAAKDKSDTEFLPDVLFFNVEGGRKAIFFSSQNERKKKSIESVLKTYNFKEKILIKQFGSVKNYFSSGDIKAPIIEFKKVNPTKYRIRVHKATTDFPLIFSESYADGWKAYIVKFIKDAEYNIKDTAKTYKILDGNERAQASIDELKAYISNGWISALGNGMGIDFISKNIENTIQNNNLPSGKFYETWLKEHIEDDFHWIVNDYGNAWWINLADIKRQDGYIENNDGSIDFEVVLEFYPQRFSYIGFFLSGTILILCVLYLFYDWLMETYRRTRGKCVQEYTRGI